MGYLMIFSSIVGVFFRIKGVDLYLQAANDVNCENCKFELVGMFGPDPEYNSFLKKLITEKITYRGFIDNIKDYYDKIDVVVLTSVAEDSLPTVLIEGLAKGKILIATDVGGVREIVDDSYGNIVVPPNDVEALKEAFITVSRYDKEKISLIKKQNKKIAKEKFSLKKQMEDLTKIYYEVLNAKSR